MKKFLVFLGMVAAAGVLYACGGGGSNSSTTPAGGSAGPPTVAPINTAPTTISNKDSAARAVNVSKTLATSFVANSSFQSLNDLLKPVVSRDPSGHRIISTVRDLQQMITDVVEKQKSLGKQVAAVASSSNCPDGGLISTSIDPIVMTFTACKMGGEYKNGIITMTKPIWELTSGADVALTVDMTTVRYAPGGYATKEHESALSLTMKIDSFDRTAKNEILTINGSGREMNYVSGTSNKLSLGDLKSDFKLNMTESTSGTVTTMIMDGPVSMESFNDAAFTAIDTASVIAFKNLQVVSNVNLLSITGAYTIKTIPACLDGTFDITTQSPITASGSGQMTVNGIVMVFNSDGTVTATINNAPQTIEASYASICSLSF